jgi:hypothetical protein
MDDGTEPVVPRGMSPAIGIGFGVPRFNQVGTKCRYGNGGI